MSSDTKQLVLMDMDRIQRSLKRMAHEIVERNGHGKSLLLFGIDDRGFAVAKALGDMLNGITNDKAEVFQLPLKKGHPDEVLEKLQKNNTGNKYILVVDDVIFSGSTMFTALNKIAEHLDPPELHTAVMIDRGHRKFPIKAEFYGMELPTKLNEHVAVQVRAQKVEKVVLKDLEN